MYLQHRGSQQSTNRAKNILFYALWVLYALTTAIVIVGILQACWIDAVSMDDHHCLTLFQLVYRTSSTTFKLSTPQYLVCATSLLKLS